jgi:hypothetical protein
MTITTRPPPVDQPSGAAVEMAPLPGPARPSLDLSPRGYWLLTAAVVIAYLFVWLSHFQYVYGINMDDYTVYLKGSKVAQDWKEAFHFFYNILQPYYFLISYLPLKSGLALPSYEVPLIGARTGQFRFLMLYTLLMHTMVLLIWAWFAERITESRLVAALSVLLFATSPTFVLWSSKLDSRLLGLPLVLVGCWLLLRAEPAKAGRRGACVGPLFLAGSLMGTTRRCT